MVRAFVFIAVMSGHSRSFVSSLSGRPGVEAVDRVTGPYDVIAVLEAENINAVSEIVATEIHSLSGVVRTTTCVSME